MKVEVFARETIKPSSPTPNHLRTFKLSIFDQIVPPVYTSIVLFYATCNSTDWYGVNKLLKESLSETLTCFYPIAGRIKDHLSVDCNDEGVDYSEARVNCTLLEVLEKPRNETMSYFIQSEPKAELGMAPLLLVQATFFHCGGIALGISISHRIADGFAFTTFIKAWARTALGAPNAVVPDFSTAFDRFPPRDEQVMEEPVITKLKLMAQHVVIPRRFVFEASKIAALRAKATSSGLRQPTRVEAVSGLLWKCATKASRLRLGSRRRPSMLIMLLNLRPRLVPPLPQISFGNVVGMMPVQAEENETDFTDFISRLRKAAITFSHSNSSCKEPQMEEDDDMELYTHSSWCKFPVYEADFGWGKPIWATLGSFTMPNVTVLMDTKDGDGIEALVSLIEEDMALFQCDQELLAFASPNPSVLL